MATTEFNVTGMTCASCVGRVERKLGKLEGVTASVNLPLEQATVTAPAGVSDEELVAAVEKAGYGATVRRPAPPAGHAGHAGHAHTSEHGEEHAADHDGVDHHDHMAHGPGEDVLKPRLIGAAVLTVPLVLISMVPALQFPHWGWVALALSAPVALWCAWPFHSAAFRAARHGSSTMDSLVSVGVLVAWTYSAVELVLEPGMTAHAGGTMAEMMHHSLYFETAAVITTFLLLGRWLEARTKDEGRSALTELMDLGSKGVAVQRIDSRIDQLRHQLQTLPELAELDLGGGHGIAYTAVDEPRPAAEIADALADDVQKTVERLGLRCPRVSLEPGRAISGPAGLTLYTVGVTKTVDADAPDGGTAARRYVAVDGGMSDNPRPVLYDADYTAVSAARTSDAQAVLTRVVGKHCESGDVLVRDVYLPEDLGRGDLLAVPATGAYTHVMASNYNALTRPAVVAVREGEARVIIRRETVEDLLRREVDPQNPS